MKRSEFHCRAGRLVPGRANIERANIPFQRHPVRLVPGRTGPISTTVPGPTNNEQCKIPRKGYYNS